MSSPAAPRHGSASPRRGLRGRGIRKRSAEVLRSEGIRRLVARAAVRAAGLFYRSVVIVGRDLSEPMPEVEGMLPVEIRLLEEGDLDALRRHRADLDPARLADRIQRLGHGHACVAAWLDGEIVASVWIAFEGARVPEIDRRIRLRAGEAFLYDSYTSERARGHGIATVRAVWTATYLRDAGYRLGIGHLVPENRPAHGPPARAGYRVLGTAGYVRIGPWRRDFVRSAGGRRRWASKRPIDVAELEAAPAAEGVPATP